MQQPILNTLFIAHFFHFNPLFQANDTTDLNKKYDDLKAQYEADLSALQSNYEQEISALKTELTGIIVTF